MVECSAGEPASNYSGFDIGLWRALAPHLLWPEGQDFSFKCMGFDAMIADLLSPAGACSGGVARARPTRPQTPPWLRQLVGHPAAPAVGTAGITISTEREQSGMRFSYPYYRSSLAVLVHAPVEEGAQGWCAPLPPAA